MNNMAWVLRRRPRAHVCRDDLDYVSVPIPDLGDNEILVRNIYLSIDPTNRLWMSDRDQYLPPVEIGQIMRGMVYGVVERTTSTKFAQGDLVAPMAGGWEKYTVASARGTRLIKPTSGISLDAYTSVIGPTGLTAYFGLLDIAKPQPGETAVVSAAAGAVGSIAGQIAKIKGFRTIGIAGTSPKCRWLTQDLGFDGAINYREENVANALSRLCPDGIDIDYENVGGEIMNAVFERMNNFGRMVLCGLVSSYNNEGTVESPGNFAQVLMRRLLIKGFIVSDHFRQFPQALEELERWVSEGRLQWNSHIVPGLENALDALGMLFSGKNNGKLLVQVSPLP